MKYTLAMKYFFLSLVYSSLMYSTGLQATTQAPQTEIDELVIDEDALMTVLAADPKAVDASLKKLDELEKKMPMTWSEKLRIFLSFLSLEAKQAKDTVAGWAKVSKEKINQAGHVVYEHARENEQLYVIGGTCIVLTAIVLWYTLHKKSSQA